MFKEKYNAWKENYCTLDTTTRYYRAVDCDINPHSPLPKHFDLVVFSLCIDID